MADVPLHRARWQKKDGETFRIRFKTLEPEKGQVVVSSDEATDRVEHWVEFRMWDYDLMIKLRKQATKYSAESRTFYVDQDVFNELKLRHLLSNWSFGEVDAHMKLNHKDGVLVDESYEAFKRLYPCVSMSIVFKMNEVLEGYE
jgi:hypothetical protein